MSQPQPNKQHNHPRKRQDISLLRILNYYRLTLSIVFISGYLNEASQIFLDLEHPSLYLMTSIGYGLLNLALFFVLRRDWTLLPQQIILNISIDIIVLGLLTYANGGVASGLGNLMIFAVAAGSILLSGRYSLMFASLASITLITVEVYRAATQADITHHYLHAGLLGMILFATALFIRQISTRIQNSESLAARRASDIMQLEKMNRLIVQRMRTGIIVSGLDGHVEMMNDAAQELLLVKNNPNISTQSMHLPTPLLERLKMWMQNNQRRTTPFRTAPENPEVQANFASLEQQGHASILIFLEDNSKAMQQAQQLKLASLGQLTASIAHEIRNPLGAISHAAQLLGESKALDTADQRLSKIIHDHSIRLNDTIENVLELSRRHQPSPQQIELHDWLNEFSCSFNETENEQGEFSISLEPSQLKIRFDSSQLQQVLNNLCQNGLRYSQQKTGKATIHFKGGLQTETAQPYLDIIDEGPGIDEDAASRLFEPFYTTERTGTGLGLYISRELCQANNARIDHIASYQDGCCFRIIFPHTHAIQ
jgi:two-component system, NtrC family, sensor histidine kinase PilS